MWFCSTVVLLTGIKAISPSASHATVMWFSNRVLRSKIVRQWNLNSHTKVWGTVYSITTRESLSVWILIFSMISPIRKKRLKIILKNVLKQKSFFCGIFWNVYFTVKLSPIFFVPANYSRKEVRQTAEGVWQETETNSRFLVPWQSCIIIRDTSRGWLLIRLDDDETTRHPGTIASDSSVMPKFSTGPGSTPVFIFSWKHLSNWIISASRWFLVLLVSIFWCWAGAVHGWFAVQKLCQKSIRSKLLNQWGFAR